MLLFFYIDLGMSQAEVGRVIHNFLFTLFCVHVRVTVCTLIGCVWPRLLWIKIAHARAFTPPSLPLPPFTPPPPPQCTGGGGGGRGVGKRGRGEGTHIGDG